jgi:hypothetical protein
MSNVVPRLSDSLDLASSMSDRWGERRFTREVSRAVAREHAQGLVVAARLDAGAHAARTGLMNVGQLSRDEEMLIGLAPIGEARYKAIVDAFAIYVAGEVGRL